ncbi:Zinc finger C2H2 [Penicillium cf. griseofulvum]|uniref:Zinc finger C2H2 n=1 Tax=Penicillium cf. griseofulvum TaxID=2972120 RepID=A0A9W9MFP4_9EURO|nr:Zinc finger C2H2 [Penicillium cf. griseofulvum]KAJ5423420.1 Zinc finger C2H2 [Penicillium cf. griseofulvum]KAJ5431312.1 Zinc finger C2H2 [Penicillium cf. griseofulvum]
MTEELENVRCTFQSCRLIFKSVSEMQHHKANADRHSYCMKCDLDFQSQQTLHLHKIMSDRHFACPECCLELRSEAGLEVHMRNNHHEGRQVACMGCGSKYKSASAVIKHIEDKECPVLSLPDKTREGANCDLHGTASVLTMGRDSPGPQSPPSDSSSEDQDTDGGVLLDLSTPRMEGKRPVRGSSDATISRIDWPELGASMTSVQGKAESTITESTGGIPIDDVLSTSMRHDSPFLSSHEAAEQLGEAGPSGSSLTVRKAGLSSYGRPILCRATVHRKIQGVDPESFWNAEKGHYYCNCGSSFLFVTTFEYHLTMEDETINDCPRCFKRFRTLAALVAHMEARYSKCAFRVTAGQIEQELSEVTRGFADIPPMIGDEMEPGEIAFDVSSQPEYNTPGSSLAEIASLSADDVSSNPAAVSSYEDDISTFQEVVSSQEDDVSSNAEAVSSNGGVVSPIPGAYSSHVESLVDGFEGLVFSDTHDEDEDEEEL